MEGMNAVHPLEVRRPSWERYWHGALAAPEEIFWNAEPERAAALDLALFREHFEARLPVVDLGCGTGVQTRYLGHHFRRVLGVDVSAAAVEAARAATMAPHVEYRTLDALRPNEADALRYDIGDAHVYVRGLLHPYGAAQRRLLVHTLETLMGRQGRAFLVEPAREASACLERGDDGAPPALRRVRAHGIEPAGLTAEELDALLPPARFTLLAAGVTTFQTIQPLHGGGFVEIPAGYRVFRRR